MYTELIFFFFSHFDHISQGELTYGKIGEWRFDKRLYTNKPPPKNLPLPPAGVAQSVVRISTTSISTD